MKKIWGLAVGAMILAVVALSQMSTDEPPAAASAGRPQIGNAVGSNSSSLVDTSPAEAAVDPKEKELTPSAIARMIGDSSNVYAAVQEARRSGNADAIRIAIQAAQECFAVAVGQGSSVVKSANKDFWVNQSQSLAADALRTQCSGFAGMSLQAKQDLIDSMRKDVETSDTKLAQLDSILMKASKEPLSDADRTLLLSALRSGDSVLANRAIQAVSVKLSDMTSPSEGRADFWYASMLSDAVKELDGVSPLEPNTKLQINEACVAGLVCQFPSGEMRPIQDATLTPEMQRIKAGYLDALRTGSWPALVSVH